ncbi:MAG: sigma-70 family RNA polymerase sigma factor [Armatimonadetes bacterium]|nr:sigma-70 family RNA polymerase sigma factor [Armatimonadota bacterium]
MQISTDEELMRRVQADDAESLGILFDRYRNRVYGFLLRFHGDAATAEDLVGELFWRVWLRRQQFRSRFYGWLFAMARTLALDDLRKGYHRESCFSDLAPEGEEEGSSLPNSMERPRRNDWIQEMAVRDQVQESLLRLPEDQRTAILLREYEELDYAEIAEIMGISVGNARLLAHRARLRLRSLLLPLLQDEEDPCSSK